MRLDDKINKAIQEGSKEGFTTTLYGNLKRYVVAYTHNKPWISYWMLVSILNNQAVALKITCKNVNVGGWTDIKTGEKNIDISTSFDNLEEAIAFWKKYNQIAIWDNVEFKEIRI